MPHIIIEHSSNIADLIEIDGLVAVVHAAALEDGLASSDALRTRAAARDHYQIADGDPSYGFVAVTVRLGPGREPAEIERFLNRLGDTVEQVFSPRMRTNPVAISVEAQLIDPRMRVNRNHVRAHRAQADATGSAGSSAAG